MNLTIIFRSCDQIDCFSGRPRLKQPKSEVMLRSLNSLCTSISWCNNSDIELVCIDDHSSEKTLLNVKSIIDNIKRRSLVNLVGSGNGYSIGSCFEYAKKYCNGLILFTEDDYLYESSAIQEMVNAYTQFKHLLNSEVVIFPADDPDRYLECTPSYIFKGEKRFWRQINKTTCTFMLHIDTLNKYWDRYIKLSQYGIDPTVSENNTINPIYQSIFCLSPIPSLACHYQYEHTLPPFMDCGELWEENNWR